MSNIQFFIQAGVQKQRGKPDAVLVREFYKKDKVILNAKGKGVICSTSGHVDESIIKENEAAYAIFSKYLADHKDELYAAASEKLNTPYEFDYQPKAEVVSVKVEEE